jgi:outer membrane protein assembly factor BamB
MKIHVLSIVVISFISLIGCRSSSLERPIMPHPEDWPMPGRSIDRRSAVDDSVGRSLPSKGWSAIVDAGVYASPCIADRAVFVSTLKGVVVVFDAESGEEITSFKFRQPIKGSPAVHDSIMIVALASGLETLQALDLLDGSTKWTASVGAIEASPMIINDLVLVPTLEGVVHARELRDGRERWQYAPGKKEDRKSMRSTPASDGRFILVPSDDGSVVALSLRDGSVVWKIHGRSSIFASPVIVGDRVITANVSGEVNCLDIVTGVLKWKAALGSPITATPASDGESAFIGTSDGRITALDAETGLTRWVYSSGAPTTAPFVANDAVVFGSYGRGVTALSKESGTPLWELETEGRVRVAPIYWSGRMFCVSDERVIASYNLNSQLANSPPSLDIVFGEALHRIPESIEQKASSGDSSRQNGPDLARDGIKRWGVIASAGTGFFSGILAATWKAQADFRADEYRRTLDPRAKRDMEKLDARSAAAFALMQISTAVLTYFLLAE